MGYDLELSKVVQEITKSKGKLVCIQLPDGLKPQAMMIVDTIQAETGARVLIWLGSNFGACDIPLGVKNLGVDLMICWGHNPFHKKVGW